MNRLLAFCAILLVALSSISGTGRMASLRPMDAKIGVYDGLEWHLDAVHARQAWLNVPGKGAGMSVCVLDTGAPSVHVGDLAGSVVQKRNFANVHRASKTRDTVGHGTFVSGEIAAHGTLTGVAPDIQLLEGRIGGQNGFEMGNAVAGVLWCIGNGANVLSLSWGGPDREPNPLKAALHLACEHNIAIAVAAGNGDQTGIGISAPAAWPADFKHNQCLLAVAASRRDGYIADFSNTFQNPREITAPGVNIVGETPTGDTTIWSGTSMSTPLVAGALALVMSEGYTAPSAVQRLLDTADAPPSIERSKHILSPSHLKGAYGAGMLNIAAATAHQ